MLIIIIVIIIIIIIIIIISIISIIISIIICDEFYTSQLVVVAYMGLSVRYLLAQT